MILAMRIPISLFALFLFTSLLGQTGPNKYWIQFTDKQNSPFSIDRPEQFLSYRAIDRRIKYQIPVTEEDFPVNPDYRLTIEQLHVRILHCSKWFNGLSIETTDMELLDKIRSLPFVREIKTVKSLGLRYDPNKLEEAQEWAGHLKSSGTDSTWYDYGYGARQIGMLNGHIIHNQGYHGQGMIIAVLDGGFTDVDINPAFDSLWANNQILDHWDFVKGTPLSFNEHNHGGQVLSLMAANLPGMMVGTAPKASYFLFRTEDGSSEYRIEEDNWVAAAEYADSAGADLINSSLGYTLFDDESMDYSYADMDGNTTRITQAADLAASKGLLVVTSASNEGSSPWHYIGAPADGDSVLSVGAVNASGLYAPFSSTGPTYDGRIKPNICAQGAQTSVVGSNGAVFNGNGTSYSSPIICGLAACLWQSNKMLNNMDIIELLQESASQSTHPDSLLGYGIPDFSKAFFGAQGIDTSAASGENLIRCFPNPFSNYLHIDYYAPNPQAFDLQIQDLFGRTVYRRAYHPGFVNLQRLRLSDLSNLSPGAYLLTISSPSSSFSYRIIKQSE